MEKAPKSTPEFTNEQYAYDTSQDGGYKDFLEGGGQLGKSRRSSELNTSDEEGYIDERVDKISPAKLTANPEDIVDIIQVDANGRGHRGIKASDTQYGDGSFLSNHEMNMIAAHQDLIRNNLPSESESSNTNPYEELVNREPVIHNIMHQPDAVNEYEDENNSEQSSKPESEHLDLKESIT